MSRSCYHFTHDCCHARLGLGCGFLYVFMGYLNNFFHATKVGDNADSKASYATMACYDDFWYCAHADSICAPTGKHAVFCRSFICWSLCGEVYAMLHFDAFFFGYCICQLDKMWVVCMAHIGESWTLGNVGSAQRVFGQEINLVSNNH